MKEYEDATEEKSSPMPKVLLANFIKKFVKLCGVLTIFTITIFALFFVFPLILKHLINKQVFENVAEYKEFIDIFFNNQSFKFIILFLILTILYKNEYINIETITEYIKTHNWVIKFKGAEVSSTSETKSEKDAKQNIANGEEGRNEVLKDNINNNASKKYVSAEKNVRPDIDEYTIEVLKSLSGKKVESVTVFIRTLTRLYYNSGIPKFALTKKVYKSIKDLELYNLVEVSDGENKNIRLTNYGEEYIKTFIDKKEG